MQAAPYIHTEWRFRTQKPIQGVDPKVCRSGWHEIKDGKAGMSSRGFQYEICVSL
jgi:hypothetical protein